MSWDKYEAIAYQWASLTKQKEIVLGENNLMYFQFKNREEK